MAHNLSEFHCKSVFLEMESINYFNLHELGCLLDNHNKNNTV